MDHDHDHYDEDSESPTDKAARILCQIIDDYAPLNWTRYRYFAECIAINQELMLSLHKLGTAMDKLTWGPDTKSQLEVDASRYRWLRGQRWDYAKLGVVVEPRHAVKLGIECPSMSKLDELIDDAMRIELEKSNGH